MQRKSAISRVLVAFIAVSLLSALSLFGQTRPAWKTASDVRVGERGSLIGTVTTVDAARSSFNLASDNDRDGDTVRVTTDSATTRYYGFGEGTEVLSGASGFRLIRAGDRVQVTGIGRSGRTLSSNDITLLGRKVGSPAPGTTPSEQSVEGVVRQVNGEENRLVVETSDRRLVTIYGTESTPVYFRGEVYRIRNIEAGDRIRVQVESTANDGVRARIIDVISDVSSADSGGRTLTSVSGRVTRVDTRAQTLRLDAGSREVRVDTRNARDSQGRTFRLTDLKVGDSIEVSGSFDTADTFHADTIRFGTGTGVSEEDPGPDRPASPVLQPGVVFETLVIYGTVERELGSEETLLVKDSDSKRELEIHLLDDFVVRLVNGSYVTADQLEKGTRVVIQAFRGRDGRYIAQTIRTR